MSAVTFEKFSQARERSAGKPYSEFVGHLKTAGVTRYVVTIGDGTTVVYGSDGDPLEVPGTTNKLPCADTFHEPTLKAAIAGIDFHLSNYERFLSDLADAGVHRYEADLTAMKIIYYGTAPGEQFEELIPS